MTNYSYSKINFYLEVLGKREDGFHNLFSFFIPLNWYDEISLIKRSDDSYVLDSNDTFLKTQPLETLTLGKAIELIKPYAKKHCGVDIYLNKKVPYGAGLGIASSNGATLLKMLNSLWECELGLEKMKELAMQIGSDCVFFLQDSIALCEGRGDVLTPQKKKPFLYPLWILKPKQISINTKEAYQKIQQQKFYSDHQILREQVKDFFEDFSYEVLPNFIFNTFYEVLKDDFSLFQEIKNFILKYNLKGGLSGSGSSFFILFKNKEQENLIFKENFSFLKKKFDFYFTIM